MATLLQGHPSSETEHFSPYRADGKLFGFVAIVTGANAPIGQAIVAELAVHGAACVYACSSSSKDSYKTLAEKLNLDCPGTKIIPYSLSPENEEDVLGLIDDVLNSWGRLDIFVTSAPTSSKQPTTVSSTTPADLYAAFEANAMAPFLALKYAPPAMQKLTSKRNYPNAAPKDVAYGSIIVVTSDASDKGGVAGPALTMSSHAALGVVRSGVISLKGKGVRINCISAGRITSGSEMNGSSSSAQGKEQGTSGRVERAGLPQEVARVVGFLASGFSSYVNGANVVVDGGACAL